MPERSCGDASRARGASSTIRRHHHQRFADVIISDSPTYHQQLANVNIRSSPFSNAKRRDAIPEKTYRRCCGAGLKGSRKNEALHQRHGCEHSLVRRAMSSTGSSRQASTLRRAAPTYTFVFSSRATSKNTFSFPAQKAGLEGLSGISKGELYSFCHADSLS